MIHNPILTKILEEFRSATSLWRVQLHPPLSGIESFIIKAFEAGHEAGVNEWYKDEEYKRGYLSAIQDMEKKVPTYDDISDSFLETHSGDWVRNEFLSTLKELKEKI